MSAILNFLEWTYFAAKRAVLWSHRCMLAYCFVKIFMKKSNLWMSRIHFENEELELHTLTLKHGVLMKSTCMLLLSQVIINPSKLNKKLWRPPYVLLLFDEASCHQNESKQVSRILLLWLQSAYNLYHHHQHMKRNRIAFEFFLG